MGTRIGSPAMLVPALTGWRGAGAAGLLGSAGAVFDHQRLSSAGAGLAAPRTSSARVGVARRGRDRAARTSVVGGVSIGTRRSSAARPSLGAPSLARIRATGAPPGAEACPTGTGACPTGA
jgi:hypothetical protein